MKERLRCSGRSEYDRDRLLTQGHQGRGGYRMAEARRMTKSELFTVVKARIAKQLKDVVEA